MQTVMYAALIAVLVLVAGAVVTYFQPTKKRSVVNSVTAQGTTPRELSTKPVPAPRPFFKKVLTPAPDPVAYLPRMTEVVIPSATGHPMKVVVVGRNHHGYRLQPVGRPFAPAFHRSFHRLDVGV